MDWTPLPSVFPLGNPYTVVVCCRRSWGDPSLTYPISLRNWARGLWGSGPRARATGRCMSSVPSHFTRDPRTLQGRFPLQLTILNTDWTLGFIRRVQLRLLPLVTGLLGLGQQAQQIHQAVAVSNGAIDGVVVSADPLRYALAIVRRSSKACSRRSMGMKVRMLNK
jgi:hypothetical protein